jgi:hypothetical protein
MMIELLLAAAIANGAPAQDPPGQGSAPVTRGATVEELDELLDRLGTTATIPNAVPAEDLPKQGSAPDTGGATVEESDELLRVLEEAQRHRRGPIDRTARRNPAQVPAHAAAAQDATVEDAKVFLKDMLLSQAMGLPQNGSSNIDEVGFNDDCTMVLTGQSRFFVVQVNFKNASFDPQDSAGVVTQIIIERGVTIYRNRQLLQAQDSSTINLQFYTVGLGARVSRALDTLHNECYAGSGYRF